MAIPFLDLSRQQKEFSAELIDALASVVSSGVFCLGPEVLAFEEEWARYCGVQAAVGVGSGTDALALSLIASGAIKKGRGNEVILPALSAGYTALAVLNAGAVPVFADIDPQTYTLDPQSVEDALSPRTRAIVPVHLYGQMARITEICALARRHSVVVIEDAAQAHGASANGRAAGTFGEAGAFSFYPTKNLGALGDGGAIISDDMALIERARILRQGGHPEAMAAADEGRNSRLDEMQAALLRVKLRRLSEWNRKRRELASIYAEVLTGVEGLRIPKPDDPESHVFHLYVVQHPERDRLRSFLSQHGIETLVHYPFLLHQQKLFRRTEQQSLPVAEGLVGRLLSLPLYPQLAEADVRTVADAIVEFAQN